VAKKPLRDLGAFQIASSPPNLHITFHNLTIITRPFREGMLVEEVGEASLTHIPSLTRRDGAAVGGISGATNMLPPRDNASVHKSSHTYH
jgi:hypothetical protein